MFSLLNLCSKENNASKANIDEWKPPQWSADLVRHQYFFSIDIVYSLLIILERPVLKQTYNIIIC